jgi:hypothetical protein
MLRVNSPTKIALGVFPKAECPGIDKFRAKNENQNSSAELAQCYGMPVADIGNDIGKGTRKGRLALALGDRSESVQQLGQASPKKKPPPLGEGSLWLARYFIASASSSSVKGTPQRSRKSSNIARRCSRSLGSMKTLTCSSSNGSKRSATKRAFKVSGFICSPPRLRLERLSK